MFHKLFKFQLSDEPSQRLKQLLLIDFLAITALFSLVYVAVSLIISYTPGVYVMLVNFVLFGLTLSLYLKHRISYLSAAHAYIGNACLVAVLLCTWFSGGLFSPVLPWFLLVPVISLLLFGISRNTTIWLVVSVGITVVFGVMGIVGFEFPVQYNTELSDFFTLTCVAGLLLIVFIVTHIFEKAKARAFDTIEQKNQEILDSLHYAKRLQEAILPPKRLVSRHLSNSFVLYKPKDIVAGDFYWLETAQGGVSPSPAPEPAEATGHDLVLFAAADCTGHGVPGAMVSVVCCNALNQATREFKLAQPASILDKTLTLVVEQFEKSEEEVKDGMDIALCAFNPATGELQYAGAHNPLWIVRKGSTEIEILKGDRQPIGKFDHTKPFTNHTVQLHKGDTIYIFSDGFVDQFGGETGKKLKQRRFRELMLSIQDQTLEEQRATIDRFFEEWKGEHDQVDDVCVIGMRV